MTRITLTLLAALALTVPVATAAPTREEATPAIAGFAAKTPQLPTLLLRVKQAGLANELSPATRRAACEPRLDRLRPRSHAASR